MPYLEPRTCKWHECDKGVAGARAKFDPARRSQEFCCDECRIARANWKQRRGATLVDLVIEGDWDKLKLARTELIKETEHEK